VSINGVEDLSSGYDKVDNDDFPVGFPTSIRGLTDDMPLLALSILVLSLLV